jgi:signal transduction histidine kinase
MKPDILASLFGVLREPVLAVQKEQIIYRNAAAASHTLLSVLPLSAIVPDFVTESVRGSFLTETELAGTRYMISGTAVDDDVVVFVFSAEGDDVMPQYTDVIASSSIALREPLAVLKHASDIVLPLAEKSTDGKTREYAAMMYRGVFGIMRALNRLDAFVHLVGGEAAPTRSGATHFDLLRVCRELSRTVSQTLDLDPGRLTFSSALRTKMVVGERQLIERMVLCLISNALTFTTPESVIDIEVKETEGRAVITVSDDGGGISDDARHNVWARYGQWREFDDTRRGGGFGLTVVQSIAKQHGGGALIESRPGEGTRVIVFIDAERKNETVSDEPVQYSTALGMTEIFTELVELIPSDKFSMKYLD